MTDDTDRSRLTMSIPAAGRKYFNYGRNASYEAAKRGDIPTITIGRRKFALVVPLERRLTEEPNPHDDVR